jgi:hypothetical protein
MRINFFKKFFSIVQLVCTVLKTLKTLKDTENMQNINKILTLLHSVSDEQQIISVGLYFFDQ